MNMSDAEKRKVGQREASEIDDRLDSAKKQMRLEELAEQRNEKQSMTVEARRAKETTKEGGDGQI